MTSSVATATRIDGAERARGEAVYTADVKLPGMLHTAILRSPARTRARGCEVDLAAALAAPGVHAAIGPDDLDELERECGYQGAPVAAVCADTFAQARAAVASIEVEWEELARDPRSRRGVDVRSRARRGTCRKYAATSKRASRGRRVVEGEYRTQVVLHNSLETHQCGRPAGSATRSRCTSRRSTSGAFAARSPKQLDLPPDKVRVVCKYMGGGFGAKNEPDDYTFVAIELARRTNRPVRAH